MERGALDYSGYFWQGERVRLRPVREDDTERFFADTLDSPSRQLLQLGIELPTSTELLRADLIRYAGCEQVDDVILFVIETLAGEPVGGLSLHSQDQKNGRFGFGVVVGRKHRGKGYAIEAVRILLRYGFWERRHQKCESACVHTNTASISLHQALGFMEEGRLRRHHFFDGQYHDAILFGLTREEFDAGQRA